MLIGPAAHRLTLGRVEAEDVGPVDLKGLGDQLWTWSVLGTSAASERPQALQSPLVGRDAELELLQNTFDRALRDRRAHLFTIYGEPGVGKSRLAHEFSQALEGATVLAGRSLPYGEGVTYWPLAEMVKCAAGIVDDDPLDVAIEKLREFCEDEAVADLLGPRLRRPGGGAGRAEPAGDRVGRRANGRSGSRWSSRSCSSSRTSTGPRSRCSS